MTDLGATGLDDEAVVESGPGDDPPPRSRFGISAVATVLPPGALTVGVGLALQGVTSYGFLVIAARALGPEHYSPLGVLWALVFVAAPGLYLPLEQEVGRALAARRALGVGGRPVVARAGLLGAALALGVTLLSLAAAPVLVPHLLDGQSALLGGFVVAVVAYSAYFLGRGTLAGSGRFADYAAVLVVEGLVRVIACTGLAVIGVRGAGAYSLAIGLPCLIGLAAVLPRRRGLLGPGPGAPWSELSSALVWLLSGSLLAQLLVNVGPLCVKAFASGGDPAAAGRFLNGLLVARVPLFLFQAVQASLLPRLAAHAAAGEDHEFGVALRRLLALITAAVVVSVAGMALLGPSVLRIVFGAGFSLTRGDLALLALGSETLMATLALAAACIALGGYARAAAAWASGIVGVAVVAAVVPGSVGRIEIAFCAGVGTATAAMGVALASLLAGQRQRRRLAPARG